MDSTVDLATRTVKLPISAAALQAFSVRSLNASRAGLRETATTPYRRTGSDSNKNELLVSALKSVAVSARKLGNRSHGRDNLQVTSEYGVQDLAELALRSIFPDVEREEWTPKSAGAAKRIDIVIPSVSTVIECKFIRDSGHAGKVADVLRIDFECYHEYAACHDLFVYIYDPNHHIIDPDKFASSLSGPRNKRDHSFSVYVLIN